MMAAFEGGTMATTSKKKAARMRKEADSLRFARRSFTYIAKALAVIGLGLLLCVLIFIGCARLSNTYIIVNEGMAARAEFILQDGSLSSLGSYFTQECLASDGRLEDTTYKSFTVSGYSYTLSFSRIRVWPWLGTLSVDVVEEVRSITGTSNAAAEGRPASPPAWTPIKYRLTLDKTEGIWRISSITTLEVNPKLEPEATADPSRSPMPMATPTATPVPSISTSFEPAH